MSVPVVTIIQVDSDVVFVRIDRSRASVPKHIPLEYYAEPKRNNLLPAPDAHSTSQNTATDIVSPDAHGTSQNTATDIVSPDAHGTSQNTATDIVSVSSSSSTNSVKVISQMKARIKKLFKPFVDIVNFFGGMFTFKKS
jgi:hypothetical protein